MFWHKSWVGERPLGWGLVLIIVCTGIGNGRGIGHSEDQETSSVGRLESLVTNPAGWRVTLLRTGLRDMEMSFQLQSKGKKEKKKGFHVLSWSDIVGRSNLPWCQLLLSLDSLGQRSLLPVQGQMSGGAIFSCATHIHGSSAWSLTAVWAGKRTWLL